MPGRFTAAALVSPALLAALAAACAPGAESAAGPEVARAAREVRVAPVGVERWERSVASTGALEAYEHVVIATKVPGRLQELLVDLGSPVRRGALLARLESRDYELRVAQSEAALAAARALLGIPAEPSAEPLSLEDTAIVKRARSELEEVRLRRDRAQALAREGVDSQARLDAVEAEYRSAESRVQEAIELVESRRATLAQRSAELEIARAQLAETSLEAPFDGVVLARLSNRGAYLATGDAVAELVRVDPLRLSLSVPEREAASIALGQTVRVELEGVAGELEGTLVRLSPTLGARSRTLAVEAELANPGGALRPGAFARARIVTDPDASALAVPAQALLEFAGIDKVFVVRAGVAEERRVTLGRRERGRAEVLAGLEAGESVVLAPGNLNGGVAVKVVP